MREQHQHFKHPCLRRVFRREAALIPLTKKRLVTGVAQEFLHRYLPLEVASLLAPTPPQLREGSFVDEALQQHFTDMLYAVQLRTGEVAQIYVLFEHKSYPEPLVAFQLLRYLVRIWYRDLQEQGRFLPVLPVVLYHGRTAWQIPLHLDPLYEGPEALRPYWPSFQYRLMDLSAYSDEGIQGEVRLRVGLLLLKYIFDPRLNEHLPAILQLVEELIPEKDRLEFLETLLRYVAAAANQVSQEELRQVVYVAFPDTGGTLMATIAEQWVQQGERKGLLKGIELGLDLRFGEVGLALLDEIAQIEDLETLEAIHQALRTIQNPADLRRLYQP